MLPSALRLPLLLTAAAALAVPGRVEAVAPLALSETCWRIGTAVGEGGSSGCVVDPRTGAKADPGLVLLARQTRLTRPEPALALSPGAGSGQQHAEVATLLAQVEKSASDAVASAPAANVTAVDAAEAIVAIVEDVILVDMRSQHNLDKERLQESILDLQSCNSAMSKNNDLINDNSVLIVKGQSKVDVCRTEEKMLFKQVSESCEASRRFQAASFTGHECDFKNTTRPDHLLEHLVCVEGFAPLWLSQARRLYEQCVEHTQAHKETSSACDVVETRHRQLQCSHQTMGSVACREHSDCWEHSSSRYATTVKEVKQGTLGRMQQAVAVEKILCFVKNVVRANPAELAKGGVGEARLAACKALRGGGSATEFVIEDPTMPDSEKCAWDADGEVLQCESVSVLTTQQPTPATTQPPTPVPTPAPTPEPRATDAATYVGCLARPSGWARPYGNVAISADGALQCKEKCGSGGFKYFGLECPMGSQVHCQCSSGLGGTEKSDNFCEGTGKPLVHPHNHCVGPYFKDGFRFGDYAVGSAYLTSDESQEVAVTTDQATYVGCLARPSGWARPYGNVAISADGALQCKEKCGSGGFKYFGLECPMGSQVHCQCSSGLGGTEKSDNFCEGTGKPLVHPHNHCVGPYFKDGFRFGDYAVGSAYLTNDEA